MIIWGERSREPGIFMYFPILNEELFGAPESSNHRVAASYVCIYNKWIYGYKNMFYSRCNILEVNYHSWTGPSSWLITDILLIEVRYTGWTFRDIHQSGQIIATSHDLTPNGGLVRGIPLISGKGWWNIIIIWPDHFFCIIGGEGWFLFPSNKIPDPKVFVTYQVVPLPVINGIVTPINGL